MLHFKFNCCYFLKYFALFSLFYIFFLHLFYFLLVFLTHFFTFHTFISAFLFLIFLSSSPFLTLLSSSLSSILSLAWFPSITCLVLDYSIILLLFTVSYLYLWIILGLKIWITTGRNNLIADEIAVVFLAYSLNRLVSPNCCSKCNSASYMENTSPLPTTDHNGFTDLQLNSVWGGMYKVNACREWISQWTQEWLVAVHLI